MKVSELIEYLQNVDPDLPVGVASDDSDYDYMALETEQITIDYATDMSEDLEDPIEFKALFLGGYP